MSSKKVLIRCGEKNNFNFTDKELKDLEKYTSKGTIFVNSNSFVEITGNFPAIITTNPYMKFVEPHGNLKLIKACRVKWVVNANEYTYNEQLKAVEWSVEHCIPVLLTFFRFSSKENMEKYANSYIGFKFNAGWFRPTLEARSKDLSELLGNIKFKYGEAAQSLIYTCDWSGNGCPECRNCIRLIVGSEEEHKYDVKSLNLSSSGNDGKCIFHCPDCWAKRILAMTKDKRPKCDVVFANMKQKGLTHHE